MILVLVTHMIAFISASALSTTKAIGFRAESMDFIFSLILDIQSDMSSPSVEETCHLRPLHFSKLSFLDMLDSECC